MNIMKTNMLLLDNKIRKDDAETTVVTQAPVPSTENPQAGMKALMFQGMQNLMVNPGLAKEVGVMNNKVADKNSADSYVAPYSSNIAFQGKFKNAAKVLTMAAMMAMAGGALTSCTKENFSQEQTQIVDTNALAAAISTQTTLMYEQMEALKAEIKALREQVDANAKAQAERDQKQLEALTNAYNALLYIQLQLKGLQSTADNQTEIMQEFRNMVYGEFKNGQYQRTAIIDAIMTLQQITETEARNAVDKLLKAYESRQITEDQFWAKLVELFKENNSLLSNIYNVIKEAVAKAEEYAKSLLKTAKEIKQNGQASLYQGQILISQNNALIGQNNIIINNQLKVINQIKQTNAEIRTLQQIATAIDMDINDLKAIVVNTGKSIEEVMTMSKEEIIAALEENTYTLQNTNNKLDVVNTNIENQTITIEAAASEIIDIIGNIDANVSDIKAMLADHFAKYDVDMAELKSLAYGIKMEQEATKKDLQKFGALAVSMANDIRNMSVDLKNIRTKLKNGVTIDYSQLEEMFKRINANQQMSAAEIIARLDAFLEKQDTQAEKLDGINARLDKLGFVVSNDVINAINNIGDNLEGIDDLNAKMDELLTVVKNFAKSFNNYAKDAMNAHGQEIALLNNIKAEFGNVADKIQTLINQGKKAEIQRANLENDLASLNSTAERIEAKLGRIPTVEEFDIMLNKHDADNQKYYGDLIKAAGVDPAQFENIKDLLKTINNNLVDFQGTSNKLLADILDRIKAMDTTAPDYTAKLNKIIELMENFKFECNCQCDCDDNNKVHEGIIGILE